ncbi:hypothetical protein HMPREF9072_00345 [Capnocytophaga sp. oral taxon 324 str. F0483]|nr:hypothetical protein HMPREF9072_00345 [Capnocytophaga sp. oral taxon 324 str. F0483]
MFAFPSFFVRLLFVFCSSFVYLPVRLAPACVAHSYTLSLLLKRLHFH